MTIATAALCAATLLAARAFSQDHSSNTVGGYGEFHFNEPDGARRGQIDFHRFVIYFSHAFTDRISLRSEVEIEHTKLAAGAARGGELALEQAYLDFHFSDALGLRAGIVLIPVGLINLNHEPPTFNGVERPALDEALIPTTWREAGVGVYGAPWEGIRYQLYCTAGLDASGFDAAEGIRGGRQEGFESSPANPSVSGRIDYSPANGLALGASFFAGGANAGIDSIGSAAVFLWSADLRYAVAGFSFRAVAADVSIGDAGLINRAFGGNVADRLFGYYVEAAYNFLPLLLPSSEADLSLFARYERYDTQARVTGFAPLTRYNRNDIVLGLTLKPVYNVAVKTDYVWKRNALNLGADRNTGVFNVGVGYFF